MDQELLKVATDVSTYVGAVSAGVSANALTDSARALVEKIRARLSWKSKGRLVAIPDELVAEVAALLADDPALRAEAVSVIGPVTIDRSIVVQATTVTGVKQVNK